MNFKPIIAILFSLTLTACEDIALQFTPKKQPVISNTPLAKQAEKRFWEILHSGDYQNIVDANRLLMAAYLQNPNDPRLAAHLGFLHIWKITERTRMPKQSIPPTIVNDIVLAKNYFADAVELAPSDARFLGFLGDSQLVMGQIFLNNREQTRGYFTLQHAIRAWPEFNYFTAGYPMTTLDAKSKYFQEALKWQWRTMDLCAGEPINRNNPNFSIYLHNQTNQGPKRACWNSWIAPYNYEGFFLNMGDMLVKSGNWQTAIKIYQNAKLDKDYLAWPYRQLLEKRISNARKNVKFFQQDFMSPDKTIAFNSGYGCVMCHQKK
ncbi:MAG: hypothetical protein ABI597_06795 [Gammaproteobacteria bacterium]